MRMKRKKVIRRTGLSLFALLAFYLFFYKEAKLEVKAIATERLEPFDIILSKGQSVQSKLISLLNFSTNNYTHVGIIVEENGDFFVLHSTPDGTDTNGIRYDDLQTFIDLSDASDCAILRYTFMPDTSRSKLSDEVERYKSAQKPFDFDFDNLSNKKIYCSELVYLILRNSSLIEKGAFDLSAPIQPKYFQDLPHFSTVNYKKNRL